MGSAVARARGAVAGDVRALRRFAAWPGERWRLLRGLLGRAALEDRHRRVAYLLAALTVVAAWAVGSVAVLAVAPGAFLAWQATWTLVGVAAATTLGAPLPFEPALFAAAWTAGPLVAVPAAAVAKALAAPVPFFVGGAARGSLDRAARRSPAAGKALTSVERFARRGGVLALAVLAAIPFFPDTPLVYLFALLRLPLAGYIGAVFAGIGVRSAAIVLAAQAVGVAP